MLSIGKKFRIALTKLVRNCSRAASHFLSLIYLNYLFIWLCIIESPFCNFGTAKYAINKFYFNELVTKTHFVSSQYSGIYIICKSQKLKQEHRLTKVAALKNKLV